MQLTVALDTLIHGHSVDFKSIQTVVFIPCAGHMHAHHDNLPYDMQRETCHVPLHYQHNTTHIHTTFANPLTVQHIQICNVASVVVFHRRRRHNNKAMSKS